MPRTAPVTLRVDPQIKAQAVEILSNYGITMSEAYNMFLHKIVMEQGIPFDLRPSRRDFNAASLEAIEEAREIQRGNKEARNYGSAEEMFDEILGSEK